ncbi:phenylalanine--tRNA ligase subunit beta [Enterococcus bulliens]
MLVSYKWLNEYVDLTNVTPKELADKMSVTGIEVEGITVLEEGLKKIVVGHVVECIDHPDSDHLHICQVDIGEEEVSQIVCGAPNVKAGINVIVALPGARIVDNVKIKKSKMRGEVSNGMICSLEEIGYSDSVIPKAYAEGIYYLPEEAKAGDSVFPYLEMDDALIELSITPNRADALSMRGVAYEVGAIYNQKPVFPKIELTENAKPASEVLTVDVQENTLAKAYQVRIIEGVTIAPSPEWLQVRLMNEGIRPINNVVDITNYILLEYGQPLHAFDAAKIGSEQLVIRRAHEKETLVTLDGEERQLTSENLLVTNGNTPLALAGVMGGLDSEITDQTTAVVLEAAIFDPINIRRTSKQFNLRSESSARFEKGINHATIDEACDKAAMMIAQLAGGEILAGKAIGATLDVTDTKIEISLERINHYLGTTLILEEVAQIFAALDFGCTTTEETFVVSVPPRRWDITIEADLIEEVARIYGYDRLPSTLPSGETVMGSLSAKQRFTRRLRQVLEGFGLTENISYALSTPEKVQQFMYQTSAITKLDWPMTEDRSALRMNLISGLLDNVAYNTARKNTDLAIYEIGRVFYQNGHTTLPLEETHVAFALTGNWIEKDWQTKADPVDFYRAKGIFDGLLAQLNLSGVTLEQTDTLEQLHPGRTALIKVDDQVIGFIGQVHPIIAKQYGISETYVLELSVDVLSTLPTTTVYQVVTKFPTVSRDVAFVVDEAVAHTTIVSTITAVAGRFLKSIRLFDVYQGESIENGSKSMAYSLLFENPEATLTDEEITKAMEKVERALTETLHATIR